MAVLLSAHQLSKAFSARSLFDNLTFAIESGERIGLIGPNGAGKSTLLKILAGLEPHDRGNLSLQRGLRVAYLAQVPEFKPGSTVEDALMEPLLANGDHDWERLERVREIRSKFELPEGPIEPLSGGWKKRVALGRELVQTPDLLLLDEPTNHLDVETIRWLEDFLVDAPFASITITHDRLFLERIATRIIELDRRNPGGLLSIPGAYSDFVEVRENQRAVLEKRETTLQNTLRREVEWLRRGAKARTTKQQARIQRAGAMMDEAADLAWRNKDQKVRLEFEASDKNPKKLIEARGISKSYDQRAILPKTDLLITPKTRLGLLGPNGCGKSTLIRMLTGAEAPDTGDVRYAEQLQVAWFEQNRELLDPDTTVLKTLCPTGETVEFQGNRLHIRSYLDRFLFTQGMMDMEVRKLSGGEQSRLLLAKLMLRPANLLVLDEPTNDLDLATLEVLETCLSSFPGAVILVTHDRWFLDQVTSKILAFSKNLSTGAPEVTAFEGYPQWESHEQVRNARELEFRKERERAQRAETQAAQAAQAPQKSTKKRLSFKEQREWDAMEATIHEAEATVERLSAESQASEVLKSPGKLRAVMASLHEAQEEVERLYARWSELEALQG
jgi:ATP-binding cassette subfamily F protein uup